MDEKSIIFKKKGIDNYASYVNYQQVSSKNACH